jgi:ketosteroid isomerase-like protein
MGENENAATIERYWQALSKGDMDTVRDIFADDVEVEWPQSGERFKGKETCLRIFSEYPGGSPKAMTVPRITGTGDMLVGEAELEYPDGKRYLSVGIFRFRDGKIARETDYFAERFPAPEWRMQWVDRD